MKRKVDKKLVLSKETLRTLKEVAITGVVGGNTAGPVCNSHYATCVLGDSIDVCGGVCG